VAVLIREPAEELPYNWMKKNKMKPKNGKSFINCTKIVNLYSRMDEISNK
jgi:hypothetical protein